jgi:hypothetical protein
MSISLTHTHRDETRSLKVCGKVSYAGKELRNRYGDHQRLHPTVQSFTRMSAWGHNLGHGVRLLFGEEVEKK